MPWLTAEEILRIPSEQLGVFILHRLTELGPNNHGLHNFTVEYFAEVTPSTPGVTTVYRSQDPRQAKEDVVAKISDAWIWLEQQRYLGPDPQQRPDSQWRIITPKGKEILAIPVDEVLARVRAGKLLGDGLHPRIEAQARAPWNGGEFETAIFNAAREIEIAVGEALPPQPKKLYGVDAINAAFGNGKPLSDPDQDPGEQEGTRALYAGFVATFKNPGSHRHFEPEDPVQAAEIIRTADLLMRMLEDRVAQMQAGASSAPQA
ncbi:MAG TPA: TIGR02391 family protein [Solirubrobacterales bacterium]|nr:TIGR02391 family protein [Solirubrobacterales bacterium]